MTFGDPIFLFALGGLSIPLVIHLWNKDTWTKVPFGSVRFLRETETRITKHFYPAELLLLFVRMLLFASLAILFALPFTHTKAQKRTAHLIDPSIDKLTRERIISTLPEDAETYWLSRFQINITDSLPDRNHEIWSAIKAFSDIDSLVIYSPGLIADFGDDRAASSSKITWIDIPAQEINEQLSTIKKGEQAASISVHSDEDQTLFQQTRVHTGNPLTITVYLHQTEKYQGSGQFIRAALTSINHQSLVTFRTEDLKEDTKPNASDWLIWLSDEEPPARRKLIYPNTQYELVKQVSKDIYSISSHIETDQMIAENFPLLLETILLEDVNHSLDFEDQRQMPDTQLHAVESKNVDPKDLKIKRYLAGWVWGIFLFFLAVERILASLR